MSTPQPRKRRDTKPGAGSAIGLVSTPSARQQRLMVTRGATIPEGKGQCPLCGKILKLRADGSLRGHRSTSTIPCLGAQPSTP